MEYSNGAITSSIELALQQVVPGFVVEPVNVTERVEENLAALHDGDDFVEKVHELVALGLVIHEAWMTSKEVEREFHLMPGTARQAARRGYVEAEKRGHDWMFKRSHVEAYWGWRRGQ